MTGGDDFQARPPQGVVPMRGGANGTASEVAHVRRAVAARFRSAGLDTPDLDARILIAHELGVAPSALAGLQERTLTPPQIARIASFAERRLASEPVAYITGEREFWSLPLRVTPATLIPRPETETVVEAALAELDRQGGRGRPWRIADLGTGSGAILLALLSELPAADGVGIDISLDALAVAQGNAARLGLANRAHFARASFSDALAEGFDLVVSNPPYIVTGEILTLAPEVRREPHGALDGGPSGLAAYRAIAADAIRILRPGGSLVLELGAGQEAAVAALAREAGLEVGGPAKLDIAGIPRALVLRSKEHRKG